MYTCSYSYSQHRKRFATSSSFLSIYFPACLSVCLSLCLSILSTRTQPFWCLTSRRHPPTRPPHRRRRHHRLCLTRRCSQNGYPPPPDSQHLTDMLKFRRQAFELLSSLLFAAFMFRVDSHVHCRTLFFHPRFWCDTSCSCDLRQPVPRVVASVNSRPDSHWFTVTHSLTHSIPPLLGSRHVILWVIFKFFFFFFLGKYQTQPQEKKISCIYGTQPQSLHTFGHFYFILVSIYYRSVVFTDWDEIDFQDIEAQH